MNAPITPTTATATDIQKYIEQQWKSRAKVQGLKHGTVTYRKAEIEFFVGAMTALQAVHDMASDRMTPLAPPVWTIQVMSGCCIVGK